MPRTRFVRSLGLLALSLLLAAAPAAARPSRPPARSLDVSLRGWVAWLWNEIGCRIDPDGQCVIQTLEASDGDIGCGIDPNGQCATAQAPVGGLGEIGCVIDPSGRCAFLRRSRSLDREAGGFASGDLKPEPGQGPGGGLR